MRAHPHPSTIPRPLLCGSDEHHPLHLDIHDLPTDHHPLDAHDLYVSRRPGRDGGERGDPRDVSGLSQVDHREGDEEEPEVTDGRV